MKYKFLLFLLSSTLLVVACDDDGDSDPVACETTDLSYANGISSILNESCATAGCHNSGTTSTFPMGNYEEVLVAVGFDRIIGAINHEEGFLPMPYPSGSDQLVQCDIDKLTAWINDGAPE